VVNQLVLPRARKLKSGNWFIQLRLNGESIPVTALTEKACIAEARLIKAQHKADKRVQRAAGVTLGEAIEKYIDRRRNVLSPLTVRTYIGYKKNRFQAVMDKPVKTIRDWQATCNDEAAKCAPKTLKSAWGFVSSVLRENNIDVPKIRLPQVILEEPVFLEPEQIPVFIRAIKGLDCEIPALLALHGLRRSEIWAMPEIDVDAKIIKVRGAVVMNEDNELVKKKTNKNQISRRDVPIIIPDLISAISKNDFSILPHPNSIHSQIDSLCRKNRLPEVGLHGLRHSFASLAYHLGVPEMYVMQIGGWSDYGTMRKIYTHFAKQDAVKSQNLMHEFFDNANDSVNDGE
jgi:integrase